MIKRYFNWSQESFFLFGPRGTGKSTWLQQQYQQSLYVDLLRDKEYWPLASNPDELISLVSAGDQQVVVIDEIQRLPSLLYAVHALIEKFPEKQFILTGSNARKLKQEAGDMLAGRAALRYAHPFMASELQEEFSLQKALKFGLLPVVWGKKDPQDALESYVATYLREEVQQEALVRNINSFARCMEVLSFSHGSLLSVTEIARDSGIERYTVMNYLQIVEDLLIGYQLPIFNKRAKRHLVAKSKFYYFDVGLYQVLRPKGPLDSWSELSGVGLEGVVLQHLRAWIDYRRERAKLYFWRTKGGSEVDFILYGDAFFEAIEIKHSTRVSESDLRGLKAFGEDYPEARLSLLYLGERPMKMGNVSVLPLEDWLKRLHPQRGSLE